MDVPRPEVCAQGAALAWENAQALVEEAEILASAGRYGRGVALLILAAEETVKAMMLEWLKNAPDPEVALKLVGVKWSQIFYDHRAKQGVLGMHSLIANAMDVLVPSLTEVLHEAAKQGIRDSLGAQQVVTKAFGSMTPAQGLQILQRFQEGHESIQWKRTAEQEKHRGIYVEFTAPVSWTTPMAVSREEYHDIRNRIMPHIRGAGLWVGRSEIPSGLTPADAVLLLSSVGSLIWLAYDPKKEVFRGSLGDGVPMPPMNEE